MVRSPHIKADYHLQLRPGTNVALVNSLAHVIVTEGLVNEAYVRERCDLADFESWARFIALEQQFAGGRCEHYTGVPAADVRAAARLYASGRNAAIYLRARRDRAQPGLDHGDGAGQSRHGDRQYRP